MQLITIAEDYYIRFVHMHKTSSALNDAHVVNSVLNVTVRSCNYYHVMP